MKDKMFLPDYLKVMIDCLVDLNKRVEKANKDLKEINEKLKLKEDAYNKSTTEKEKEYRKEGNRHEKTKS